MYVVVGGNLDNTVWKVSGDPRASSSTLTAAQYLTTYASDSSISVRSMQTLEQFGFFMTTYDTDTSAQTVTQYQLDM